MKEFSQGPQSKFKSNFEHGSTIIYISTQTVADGTDH
jgi:dTDP-4-dehydrorhamnose reductase